MNKLSAFAEDAYTDANMKLYSCKYLHILSYGICY